MNRIMNWGFTIFLLIASILLIMKGYNLIIKTSIDLKYYEKEAKINYLRDLNYAQEGLSRVLTKMEADSLNKEVQKMIEEELK